MMEAVQETGQSLAFRIREMVTADEVQLPPLPEVAMRVQEILSSEIADTKELDRLISEDQAIVAALLRLANSAAFGGLRQVEDLSTAIQRIGLRQVGALVTGLSLKGHFNQGTGIKKELFEVLWDHAVTSAFAARAIARTVGFDSEKAFLAGLLHDCGMVLVLTAVARIEKMGEDLRPTRNMLTRAKRAETTIAFLAFYGGLLFARALWLDDPLSIPLHQVQNGALLIFAFFMISDPKTTPNSPLGRVLFAGIVASIAFTIQFIFYEPNGPILALIISAPLVPLIDALLQGTHYRWETARDRALNKGV